MAAVEPETGRASLADLPEDLQEWAKSEQWTSLRPIQSKAWTWFSRRVPDRDLIVCAPTATGKTEAVFLPVLANLPIWGERGFDVLYICPLKALVDQQTRRLEALFKLRDRRVTAWHGEARAGRAAAETTPEGVLVITPESLERILRTGRVDRMFGGLKAVVIDELHAFFGSPRGVQIVSQLARLEHELERRIPRFGLSATLSTDVEAEARAFLRPSDPGSVEIVADDTALTPIIFDVRAYVDIDEGDGRIAARDVMLTDLRQNIAEPMSGPDPSVRKALVFCNARSTVEWCATELRSPPLEGETLSNLVFPHHGSLERSERRIAEEALRNPERATLVVSSPTLELGLDVGDIELVVQIDPGPSVSSLRQRLGRSGRRAGKVGKLVFMIRETAAAPDAHPLAKLHVSLAQGLAQIALVEDRRFEAPAPKGLNLSTFVQQTLSMADRGVEWDDVQSVLLEKGPFDETAADDYRQLIDRLSRAPDPDRPDLPPLLVPPDAPPAQPTYRLTVDGERLVQASSFGAAFAGGRQYSVRAGGELLGQLPSGHNLKAGDPVFFAGRRWAVQSVSELPPTVHLRPSGGGRPPRFAGSAIAPSAIVVETMRDLYAENRPLPHVKLNQTAQALWADARAAFAALDLARTSLVGDGGDTLAFPWTGARVQATLLAALRHLGMNAAPAHAAIIVFEQPPAEVRTALDRIAEWNRLPDAHDLVRGVKSPRLEKFDGRLGPYLQRRNYASACLDIDGAKAVARAMLA